MKLTIPEGTEINKLDNNRNIKIKIPHTIFWVLGEKTGTKWNIYLINPDTNYKEIIKENFTTESFARFSSIVLKTPFPYEGKRSKDSQVIKRFINKNQKNNELKRKSRKLQVNSKRNSKNESYKSKTYKNHRTRRKNLKSKRNN